MTDDNINKAFGKGIFDKYKLNHWSTRSKIEADDEYKKLSTEEKKDWNKIYPIIAKYESSSGQNRLGKNR